VLRRGDLVLDPRTRQVRRGDRAIMLTRPSSSCSSCCSATSASCSPGTSASIRVWDYGFGSTSNTLKVHIGYLPRKLESAGLTAGTSILAASVRPDGSDQVRSRTRLRSGRDVGGSPLAMANSGPVVELGDFVASDGRRLPNPGRRRRG
jgi:hypothetical protein